MRRSIHTGATLAFAAALYTAPNLAAQAQVEAPAEPENEMRINAVVVTARQREENLQDVPLTINTFSADQLASKGGTSLNDIALLTPGLNFEAYATGGYPVITLRGLSATSILSAENNVSSFYAGIYLPRAYMIDPGLTGLQRVEVVKGPQSALYGRNAFAGAINYVPLTPPDQLSVESYVTAGTDERFDYGLTVGGPLVEGYIHAIAGFASSSFDGTWDNAHPNADAEAGGTTGKMGGWDNETLFATLDIIPTDRLRMTLGINHSERETEATGRYNISRDNGDGNCSLVNGVYQFFCGALPVLESVVDPRSMGLKATSDVYRLDAEYDFTDELTGFYQYGRVDADAYSYDQTSINSVTGDSPAGIVFLGLPVGNVEADSHELRLSYARAGTRLSAGAFYSDMRDDYQTQLVFGAPLGTVPITPASTHISAQNVFTEVLTKSVFASASQDFLDGRLNLGLEGRYTEEGKTSYDRLSGSVLEAQFDFFTPRLFAQYYLNDRSNVYASAAKGVKSGGFNSGNILDEERAFQPEENWTYEIGTKNQLLDDRLQLNANLFYVDWSDLQTLSVSGNPGFLGTLTRNVGSATSYGVEIDLVAQLTDALQAGLGLSYADPTYGDDLVDPRYQLMRDAGGNPITICDGITCPADGSIGGNTLARQSKYQASAYFSYTDVVPYWDGGEFTIGGDVGYKSKQYIDPLLLTWADDRVLVNLNGSVSFGRFRLEAFIKNLLDEEYAASATYNLTGLRQVRYQGTLGEKRTMGLTLRYRY